MGQELYHMEEGDLAVIFPDVIHHYQVFSPGENKAVYLWAKPVLIGKFADIIQNSCPEDPVIKKGAGASGYCKCGTVSQGKP